MTEQLTQAQLERQDWVDDACEGLIKDLAGADTLSGHVEHDMELIGIVRDAVQEVICDKLHLMTEIEFYPYIEEEPEKKTLKFCPGDKCPHYSTATKYPRKCYYAGPQCWKGYLDVFFSIFKWRKWSPKNNE